MTEKGKTFDRLFKSFIPAFVGVSEGALRMALILTEWYHPAAGKAKPWEQSTGPTTAEGKATSSHNAWCGGERELLRELARDLREQDSRRRELKLKLQLQP